MGARKRGDVTAKGRRGREPRDASRFGRRQERTALEPPEEAAPPVPGPQPVDAAWDLWPRAEGHMRAGPGTKGQDSYGGPRTDRQRPFSPSPSASASFTENGEQVLGPHLRGSQPGSGSPVECLTPLDLPGRPYRDRWIPAGALGGPSEKSLARVDTFPGFLGVPHQVLSLCCDLGECVCTCSLLGPLQSQQLPGVLVLNLDAEHLINSSPVQFQQFTKEETDKK